MLTAIPIIFHYLSNDPETTNPTMCLMLIRDPHHRRADLADLVDHTD